MTQQNSFDIVSKVDLQEVDNALNQANKEIIQRYDFKGTKTHIDFNKKENEITVVSDDDFKLKAVIEIIQNKMVKRGISLKALSFGQIEAAAGGNSKIKIGLQNGIDKDNARLIIKMIKNTKLKVQAQMMDDQVRVTGRDKDDLQTIIQLMRGADLKFAVQFVNYR